MTDQHDPHTAALPTPGAGPAMRMLDVAAVVASMTNPRKTFNSAKLAELAESIKASGVHQPVLVRPLPADRLADTFAARRQGEPLPTHEMVAGERRWRACQLAGVVDIPVMIRELSDTQVLEIQIVENLQREDVSELEEAEGYEYLMQQSGLNADQVGAKIGKSRSYVYARLKLTDLCQGARAALREGQIDASKALYLARIPNEAQQLKALKEVVRADWEGEIMSVRAVQRHVQDNYMLRLDKAAWPLACSDLLPSVGSCSDCTKRTGASPDLFADVGTTDMCVDPPCYRAKEQAHSEQLMQEAKAKGQTVIAGAEAAELTAQGHSGKIKGYRRLDVAEDSPTDQPLRKIIGKQMVAEGIEPTKIENPRKKGELIDTLPNEVVLRLLKAVEGQAKASGKVAKEVRDLVDEKKAKQDAKAMAQYERAWRDLLIDNAWACLQRGPLAAFSADVHRYLVLRTVRSLSTDNATAVADVLGLGKVGAHSALIDYAKSTLYPDQLQLLCIMQCDSDPNDRPYDSRPANEGLMLVASAVLQDRLPVVINDAQTEAAEKHLQKPEPVQSAAPKSASTPSPAAHASGTREAGAQGSKGKTGPAAHARATAPKTSKEEASAAIAAALIATGSHDVAPSAHSNEAPPVADAQAAAPSITVKRAKPAAPTADTPDAGAQAPVATQCQAGAGAETGAAVPAGVLGIGALVRVLATATGKKQKPWHDYDGTVVAQTGPQAWDVSIPRGKKTAPIVVGFHSTELEVMA